MAVQISDHVVGTHRAPTIAFIVTTDDVTEWTIFDSYKTLLLTVDNTLKSDVFRDTSEVQHGLVLSKNNLSVYVYKCKQLAFCRKHSPYLSGPCMLILFETLSFHTHVHVWCPHWVCHVQNIFHVWFCEVHILQLEIAFGNWLKDLSQNLTTNPFKVNWLNELFLYWCISNYWNKADASGWVFWTSATALFPLDPKN